MRVLERFGIFFLILTITGCQSLNLGNTLDSSPKENVERHSSPTNVNKALLLDVLSIKSGLIFSQTDEQQSQKALEHNFTHQSSEWIDEVNKTKLSITPTRTFELDNKVYCRDYKAKVMNAASTLATNSIACRQSNGVWRVKKD